MENQNSETSEKAIDDIFAAMRRRRAAEEKGEKAPKNSTEFKILPNGTYLGRVYILIETMGNENSPNYGLKKYEFQLTVTEGEHKGQMAYYHRIIMPHNLATPPATGEGLKKLEKWRADVDAYLEKTDEIMKACGVDISDDDKIQFVKKIAANNRKKQIVNFTMKDGHPYINYPIVTAVEDQADSLFHAEATLPNGNDLPLN